LNDEIESVKFSLVDRLTVSRYTHKLSDSIHKIGRRKLQKLVTLQKLVKLQKLIKLVSQKVYLLTLSKTSIT
jgi:hypothetical protein